MTARSREPPPEGADHREAIWTSAVGLGALVLFLSTISSDVRFGDSPESVAGVEALGVVHAPGYAVYIAMARLFSEVVRLGELALRVNLFSAVCAAASTAVVFRLGRRLGVERFAAAVGAAALATGASFWFYAGYAKAYAFTALLLTGALWAALSWADEGGRWRLAVGGVLGGLSLGASYQVVALAVPGIALLVWSTRRRVAPGDVLTGLGAGLVGAGTAVAWTVARAARDPAVNWGDADTPTRLLDLVLMRDFGFGTPDAAAGGHLGDLAALPLGVLRAPLLALVELGPVLLVLAAVGAAASFTTLPRPRAGGLLAIFTVNVLVVQWLVFGSSGPVAVSSRTLLASGGFFLAANVVVALWVALGTAWALQWLSPAGGGSRARRRRAGRRGGAGFALPDRLRRSPHGRWSVVVVAALGVATSTATHADTALHREPPFATAYAQDVLTALPRDTVLFTWGTRRGFALEYLQVVERVRPDVEIVDITQLQRRWYRDQLRERLPARLGPARPGRPTPDATDLIRQLDGERPVRAGILATVQLERDEVEIGFRLRGVVADVVVPGSRVGVVVDETAERLDDGRDGSYRFAALYGHPRARMWPTRGNLQPYTAAHLFLGRALTARGDHDEAAAVLSRGLRLDPDDEALRSALVEARTGAEEARRRNPRTTPMP